VGTLNGFEQLELAGGGSLTWLVDSQAAVQPTWTSLLIPQCRQDVKNAARCSIYLRSMLPSTSFLKDVAEAEVILDKMAVTSAV
jgi:hypothetical protein